MLQKNEIAWIRNALDLNEEISMRFECNPCSGINNETFLLTLSDGRTFLYRRAGIGTDRFCNREQEAENYARLAPFHVTDHVVKLEPATGAKLTSYYPEGRICDARKRRDLELAAKNLRALHRLPVVLRGVDDPFQRLQSYESMAAELGSRLSARGDYARVRTRMEHLHAYLELDAEELVPVHADALAANHLFFPDGRTILIDLEFAAMGHPFTDLADLVHDADLSKEACLDFLEIYLQRDVTRHEQQVFWAACACVALMWSMWAECKVHTEAEQRGFYEDYRDMSVRFSANASAFLEKTEREKA